MMAKSMEKLHELQIVCWNRDGYKMDKDKGKRKQNQITFWGAVGKPAIVFLQEEVWMIGKQGQSIASVQDYSLSSTYPDYEELFVAEVKQISKPAAETPETPNSKMSQSTKPAAETPETPNSKMSQSTRPVAETPETPSKKSKCYSAIAYRKNTDIAIHQQNINIKAFLYKALVENGSTTNNIDKIKELFQYFNVEPEQYQTYLSNGHKIAGESITFTVTIEQIVDMHDRVCIVPLNISGKLILAVSVHGKHRGLNEEQKQLHIKNIFTVLDAIGQSIRCTAIVIGGDFNLDINKKMNETLGFKILPYNPTIHRALRAFTCIDYFVYKNYHINEYEIEVTDVKHKMLISCPGLVINDEENPGQFNIDLDNSNFKKVEAISDHDPLYAKLTLYRQSSATSSTAPQGAQNTDSLNDDKKLIDTMKSLDLNAEDGKK